MPFWKIERLFAYLVVVAVILLGIPEILPESVRYQATPYPYPLPSPTFVPTATADPRPQNLPDHCAATGYSYWLQFTQPEYHSSPYRYDELPSPDGRYRLVALEDGVFLQETGTDTAPVRLSEYVSPVFYQYQWAPASNRLAYLHGADTNQYAVTVFDVSQGLEAITEVTFPVPMRSYYDFKGWSNTGDYLILSAEDVGRAIWSVDQQRIVYQTSVNVDERIWGGGHTWSQDDSRVAYIWEDERYNRFISMVSIDNGQEIIFPLRDLGPLHYQSIRSVRWSPDNRRVALYYRDGSGIDTVTLYDLDHSQYRLNIQYAPETPVASWSADGQTVLYWETLGGDTYRLSEWNPVDDRHTVLLKATQPPFFDQEGSPLLFATAQSRMATFTEHPDGTVSIVVMNADGSDVTPLLENVAAAGYPDWSPTGETVAAAWAVEEDGRREVRVSWMQRSGLGYTEMDGDFIDARNFLWSPDGRVLTFVGVGESGFSVEWVEVETGEVQVLLTGLSEVVFPAFDERTGDYSVRWQKADGQQGFAAFDRDGSPLYQIAFHDPADTPIGDFSDPFWSPDGQHVALKSRTGNQERLLLMAADGSDLRLVRSGESGLGDPVWSPDGSLLAFSHSVGRGPIWLSIVDTEGDARWSISTESLYGGRWPSYTTLEWLRCG
jgi:Tol biopolymer transport system component